MSHIASILGLVAALGGGSWSESSDTRGHDVSLRPGMKLEDVDRLNEVDLKLAGTTGPSTSTWIYSFTDVPDELYFLHFDRKGGTWVLRGWDVE